MRKVLSTAIAICLTALLLGCPPPADSGKTSGEGTGETEAPPTTGPAEGGDTGTADAPKEETGIDIAHVKVGQKYTFKSNHGVEMTMIYEVKEITDTHLKYELTNIMNGSPVSPPNPVEIPLKAEKGDTAPIEKPEILGEETFTISGQDFECEITEVSGYKNWTSMKWPNMIKQMQGDKTTMELLKVE